MSDKKYFVLMENGKDTSQVFASKQPRGAALKAATRGHTNIRLRERGTKRVHVFTAQSVWLTSLLAALIGYQTRSRRPTSRRSELSTSEVLNLS